jgi:hypothetical protein
MQEKWKKIQEQGTRDRNNIEKNNIFKEDVTIQGECDQ